MDVCSFIKAVLAQDENTIRSFFHKDAYVNWHCSNEHFTVDEFIIANCEYPGDWDGTVERVEVIGDLFITVTKVYPQDRSVYFHVVSFIRTANDKITSMDEYWADDGNPPQWRIDSISTVKDNFIYNIRFTIFLGFALHKNSSITIFITAIIISTGTCNIYNIRLTLSSPCVPPRDRKSTRLNSSHIQKSRMPSSA